MSKILIRKLLETFIDPNITLRERETKTKETWKGHQEKTATESAGVVSECAIPFNDYPYFSLSPHRQFQELDDRLDDRRLPVEQWPLVRRPGSSRNYTTAARLQRASYTRRRAALWEECTGKSRRKACGEDQETRNDTVWEHQCPSGRWIPEPRDNSERLAFAGPPGFAPHPQEG